MIEARTVTQSNDGLGKNSGMHALRAQFIKIVRIIKYVVAGKRIPELLVSESNLQDTGSLSVTAVSGRFVPVVTDCNGSVAARLFGALSPATPRLLNLVSAADKLP
jgi:hypothetical protein